MDDKDTSADTITIDIGNALTDDIYIDTTSMSSYNYTYSSPTYTGNVTISGIGATGSSGSFLTAGLNGTSWSTISQSSGLHVNSDATIEGDLKVKGISIVEALQKIESRLAILRPDPEKLEHFAALKKAYEHYKTLEALCEIPKEEDKE